MGKSAAIVIIGNEILSGQIEDCNSLYFARELRGLGVPVRHIAIVPDEPDEIAATLRALAPAHEYVFTSGGIGPTHDDVTIEGVARAFGVRVVRNPLLEERIRAFYRDRATAAAFKMSEVPEGAELVTGNGLSFPLIIFRNIYIFPGIPRYLKSKFEAIKERFREEPFHARILRVRQHEASIADVLAAAEKRFGVRIGSYPIIGEDTVLVKVVIESKEPKAVEDALAFIRGGIDPATVEAVE